VAKRGFVILGVSGGRKLEKRLARMEKRTAGRAIRGGMKAAMEPVRQLAVARAPVDTGRMRRSIKAVGFFRRSMAGARVQTGTRKQLRIPAESKHYYPAYVEYGHSKRSARPFLRSALHDRRKQVLGRVRREIINAIEKA
jgi:HK97 gp10 family phage protein